MIWSWLKSKWPYAVLALIASVYLVYILVDSRYFFYDDFTALTFVVPRSYGQVVVDSLKSGDIDRHKIVGYLVLKGLYDVFGVQVEPYFISLFAIHVVNSWLVYRLLLRVSGQRWVSLGLAAIFAWRFYLWWIANIENYLGGLFYFLSLGWWLSFCETGRRRYLGWIVGILPLMVYSYGPTVFLYPALVPLTIWLYGWRRFLVAWRRLVPFAILLLAYVVVYSHVPDSLTRFTDPGNPYYRPVSIITFVNTQAIYLNELTRLLPVVPAVAAVAAVTAVLAGLGWPLVAFWLAILPSSFFPNHTMWYYLYFPVIFLFLGVARQMAVGRKWAWTAAVIVLFNPLWEVPRVAFRLRHPSINFEKQAMIKITAAADAAIATGQTEIQLSNWEVTPNLHGAITYQALPLFMTHPSRFNYRYSYSRDTQVLTIYPK